MGASAPLLQTACGDPLLEPDQQLSTDLDAFSERLWVYGRQGKPCLECGTSIQRFLQGDMARSTYFCPGCRGRSR